ncbi:hypothetical protein V2J09_012448 [Rumex salicifolius]
MSTRRLRQRLSTATRQPPPPSAATSSYVDDDDSYVDSAEVPIMPATRKLPLRMPRRRTGRTTTVGSTALSRTLASTAYLANLLPTGTHLAFQILTPVFTNNGSCDAVTSTLTLCLLVFLASSCFLASFTDSFRSPNDDRLYYGLATRSGMWLFDYPGPDTDMDQPEPNLKPYRLRMMDWAHATMSVLVFGAVALRDGNVVGCLYPHPTQWARQVLDIVPIGVGTVCGLLFVAFPPKRHGIGYPSVGGDQ